MSRGEIQPGAFLNQDELAARLGVSRTPLRDALLQLEAEGFVAILPRRGVRVEPLTLRGHPAPVRGRRAPSREPPFSPPSPGSGRRS